MTKIEKVIRQVSDLRDFYIRLQRMKKASPAPQSHPPPSPPVPPRSMPGDSQAKS